MGNRISAMLKLPLLLLALLPLAFAGKLWNEVCTQSDTKDLPFCDPTAALDTRVDDYVKRVSLSDKAANMHNGASGVTSLHIPPYQWGSEGLHGPLEPCVCAPDNSACRCPTSFPCPSSLGTAFNDTLYFLIGQADGREARAINNLRNHVTQNKYGDGIDYWSPTINMQRDPRWGRNQEVPGEDPQREIRWEWYTVEPVSSRTLPVHAAYSTVPAALAMRGHRSAHSFATGPLMAEPFRSPLTLTITAALSSK